VHRKKQSISSANATLQLRVEPRIRRRRQHHPILQHQPRPLKSMRSIKTRRRSQRRKRKSNKRPLILLHLSRVAKRKTRTKKYQGNQRRKSASRNQYNYLSNELSVQYHKVLGSREERQGSSNATTTNHQQVSSGSPTADPWLL
jgi:hypothetical protein